MDRPKRTTNEPTKGERAMFKIFIRCPNGNNENFAEWLFVDEAADRDSARVKASNWTVELGSGWDVAYEEE